MRLSKKKQEHDFIKEIYKIDRFNRYIKFIFGVLISSISYNIFLVPNHIVLGGMSGLGIIINYLTGLNPSTWLLLSSVVLIIVSFIFLGKNKTATSIVGSILYPVFISLTSGLTGMFDFGETEPLLLAVMGAVISGFGSGLTLKAGFTTGGTDILNQIISKYFKMSMGRAMYFTDGVIICLTIFIFGWQRFFYSIIGIYVVSIIVDKVILGISNSKAFYIITKNEVSVKKFILDHLSKGVTVVEARGGYTGNVEKVIMCIIPTKDYFKTKEGIMKIDPNAFFLVTDAYEVAGGKTN